MKRCYKIRSLLITALVIVNLSGCSEKGTAPAVSNTNTESSISVSSAEKQNSVSDPPDNGNLDSVKDNAGMNKTITDMGGRKVEINGKIEKVFGANPMATILLFTLVPDKIAAWNAKLPNQDILPEKFRNLPAAGSMGTKQQAASPEEILTYNPELVIYAQTEITEQAVDKADKISKQLGKPVVLVNGSFESTESTYELLGQIFDCSERSDELVQYYKETLSDIKKIKSEIKEEDKVKVYYGKEADALTTSGNQSVHAKLIEMVGGVNAAVTIKGGNDAVVNMEDVVTWEPDIILLSEANENEKASFTNLMDSAVWNKVKAVQNDKVYVSPRLLFSWFDRPPSINELMGIQWLAQTLYPDYYQIDISSQIKEFYKKFYQIELKEEDLRKILSEQ